jgi:hypothetical protein
LTGAFRPGQIVGAKIVSLRDILIVSGSGSEGFCLGIISENKNWCLSVFGRADRSARGLVFALEECIASGFGSFIGSWISGLIVQMCMVEGEASILAQWSVIWSIPALAAGATALFYALSSRGRELSH